MNYIYGEVNQKVEKNTYKGISTPTADVVIDNSNNTIAVNAHADTSYVENLINKSIDTLDYKDSSHKNNTFVKDVQQENGLISAKYASISLEDLPTLSIDNIINLRAALEKKQDSLEFKGDKASGIITDNYLKDQLATLEGALRYLGESSTNPFSGIVTINSKVIVPKNGDIVTFNNSKQEFVYISDTWVLRRDDTQYIEKNKQQIKNIDISSKAEIEQSKIKGLRGDINNPGYLDKLDNLIGNSSDSIQKQIESKINELNTQDEAIPKEFVTFVKQSNGKIAIGRKKISADDIPILQTFQIANLDDNLNFIKTRLDNSLSYPKLEEYDQTKFIYAIYLDSNNKLHVLSKSISVDMIPENIPLFKISGYAKVAKTGDYGDLKNTPKININLDQHYLEFTNM